MMNNWCLKRPQLNLSPDNTDSYISPRHVTTTHDFDTSLASDHNSLLSRNYNNSSTNAIANTTIPFSTTITSLTPSMLSGNGKIAADILLLGILI
jgi:hypothetical protein